MVYVGRGGYELDPIEDTAEQLRCLVGNTASEQEARETLLTQRYRIEAMVQDRAKVRLLMESEDFREKVIKYLF